jgi:mono/diheme cytochrome c family protein
MNGARLAAICGAVLFSHAALAEPDNYVEAARGKALITAGDCVACHTAPGGQSYAGGLALDTPFGAIMTPNLTPDPTTGLGNWTADDFYHAMHEGIGRDGQHLYPAFPYTAFTKVTRADSDAIFAYLRTLPAVVNAVDRNSLPFPFDIRAAMIGWNALFFTPGTFTPDPKRSDEFNRGAYLVEGLGHCGTCHTPMNAFGANKADVFLQANQIDNWIAPNITDDARLGLGAWSVEEIMQYLSTGQTANTVASGPMADVIVHSTSQMPQTDLHAIAVYLKQRGAAGSATPAVLAASDPHMQSGAAIYVDTCAACHTTSGAGIEHAFPRLAKDPAVQQDDPASLIRVVLAGTRAVATNAEPTALAMPSLGYRLTDAQVADVLTYVRNSWGNAAAAVAASDVAKLRTEVGGPVNAATP